MKSAKRVVGLSLALGLMMVGCGPAAEPLSGQEALQSREDALPDCSDPAATFTAYYSDATYTTQIGGRGCSCYAYMSWGKTSIYRQYFSNDSCQ